MGTIGEDNENKDPNEKKKLSGDEHEFDGDEIDDDLVFSTIPQRSSISTTKTIHFDEIDDDEMRLFAESFEQEQKKPKMDDSDDDELCEDYARKMQTPTKSTQMENNKRKEPCIEDLDALLDDNDDESSSENKIEQQQMSPVFKKKP